MVTEAERAVEVLRINGHIVWRMDFPPPPFAGLYRIDGGPELTESQLIHAAQTMGATVLATDGVVTVAVRSN